METIESGGRTGRRPGGTSSRDAILGAARELFTAHGFKGATVRAIAAQAGADAALIRHFFGGKEGLFLAAMELPPDATGEVLAVFDAPAEEWGELLTRAYLSLWEDPDTAAPLRATLVSAFTNEQALQHFRAFLVATVLVPASRHLPPDDPELRLSLAMGHLIGVALARHLLVIPPIAAQDVDSLVSLVAPAVQRYLCGPLPRT